MLNMTLNKVWFLLLDVKFSTKKGAIYGVTSGTKPNAKYGTIKGITSTQ